MRILTFKFIRDVLSRYYERAEIEDVPKIGMREFAFFIPDLKEGDIVERHISFTDVEELRKYLIDKTPRDAYYSAAYYLEPTLEMDRKNLVEADLIFDIDADHLEVEKEEIFVCTRCGVKESSGDRCDDCGGELRKITWITPTMLKKASEETYKLVEILSNDFGIPYNELEIYFSGHRGYHVRVTTEWVRKMTQPERKEIVDYLICRGIDVERHGIKFRGDIFQDPGGGWGRRIFNGLKRVIEIGEYRNFDFLSDNDKKRIEINKERILMEIGEKGFSLLRKCLDRGKFMKIIEKSIEVSRVHLDPVVTQDMHRLFRLPGSVHGKIGLIKVRVKDVDELRSFDPFEWALLPFREEGKFRVYYSPRFNAGGDTYGPYQNEVVSLPICVGTILVFKGLAEVERK